MNVLATTLQKQTKRTITSGEHRGRVSAACTLWHISLLSCNSTFDHNGWWVGRLHELRVTTKAVILQRCVIKPSLPPLWPISENKVQVIKGTLALWSTLRLCLCLSDGDRKTTRNIYIPTASYNKVSISKPVNGFLKSPNVCSQTLSIISICYCPVVVFTAATELIFCWKSSVQPATGDRWGRKL